MPLPSHDDERHLDAPETRIVDAWRVACDGGGAGSGHPRVWLQIPHDKGFAECGYCDAKFVHREFAGNDGAE